MAAAGVAAPSRMMQRKPLGEVNVVDTKHHGNAKQPLRTKSSLLSVTDAVETKPLPHSQSSHRPKSQLHSKEQLGRKLVPARGEQVCMKQRRWPNTWRALNFYNEVLTYLPPWLSGLTLSLSRSAVSLAG